MDIDRDAPGGYCFFVALRDYSFENYILRLASAVSIEENA
jgi:hypothetical protein